MLFPEIRRVILMPRLDWCCEVWRSSDFGPWFRIRHYPDLTGMQSSRLSVAGAVGGCGRRRERITEHALLVAAALHRRRDSHRFAVLRDGATGDINTRFAQSFHDGVVGKDHRGVFRIDQLLDVVTDRLRGMGFAAIGR